MSGGGEGGRSARRRAIAIAIAAGLLASLTAVAAPAAKKDQPAKKSASKKASKKKSAEKAGPPKLRARAWVLIDALDGQVLASKAPDRELPIASTTKLMTTFLALKKLKPSERVKVPPYRPTSQDESLLNLDEGEKLTTRDLLYGMLLPSANDAAETVAVGVSGSERRFVALMNRQARALGLDHTHYSNPIGLDASGNYSSADDLVSLADRLLANRLFARIVDTPSATLRSGSIPRKVTTRNTLLLEDPTVIGVKTGHTDKAGYVLVAAARRNGATLLSAVLGTSSEKTRDVESEKLLDYGFTQYRSRRPVRAGEELASPDLDYRSDNLALVAKRAIPASVRRGQRLRVRVVAPDEISGAINKGQRLGRVVVSVDGRVEGASPLVAAEAVPAATLVQKAVAKAKHPIILIPVGLFVIIVGLLLARRRRHRDDEDPTEPTFEAPVDREGLADQDQPKKPKQPEKSQKPREPEKPRESEKPREPEEPREPEKPIEPEEPQRPKSRRLRRRKGPQERTPEERRRMHDERMRRRRERGG